jgi:hypothetical protein
MSRTLVIEPLYCSQGGIPYNKAHLDAKDAEIARLRALLQKLDWKSIDKDNMEFSCRVPYNVMDETRRALETKPCQPGLIPDERVEGPRLAKEPKP